MFLITDLYHTFLDAIFPVSAEEREVLALDSGLAFDILPRAPRCKMPLACSLFSYKDERVRRLVWAIKYKKSARAAAISAESLFHVIHSYSQAASPIVILPMPISSQRRRERGFNQCELMADAIERICAVRMETGSQPLIIRDLLVRRRHRSRQTLKDREDRLKDSEDIFAVNEAAARKLDYLRHAPSKDSQHLILVLDDVITTGGTIRDAIMTVRAAGFEKTFGLSLAH